MLPLLCCCKVMSSNHPHSTPPSTLTKNNSFSDGSDSFHNQTHWLAQHRRHDWITLHSQVCISHLKQFSLLLLHKGYRIKVLCPTDNAQRGIKTSSYDFGRVGTNIPVSYKLWRKADEVEDYFCKLSGRATDQPRPILISSGMAAL